MKIVANQAPPINVSLSFIKDSAVVTVFSHLIFNIRDTLTKIMTALNFNAILYIAQDAQPTPEEGQFIIWKDTNGASGTPKAIIVTVQDSVTYTFGSRELIP